MDGPVSISTVSSSPALDLDAIFARATAAEFDVAGTPIPQGSMRAMHHRSSGRIITTSDNAKTRPWKLDVIASAVEARRFTCAEPAAVHMAFRLLRPKGHTGKRGLLPSAPTWPATKPDIDKLARAILDALVEARVLTDDALVGLLQATKRYATDGETPGVHVRVWAL